MTRKGGTLSAEAAENQLNVLIERRSKERDEANWAARAWAESARRYNLRQAAKRRREWIAFHRGLGQLHSKLAREHEEAAQRLEAHSEEVGVA
jgi:hypothetical protein